MTDDREPSALRDEEAPSAEDPYELWDWARAAGVSAEELRKALQQGPLTR